MGKLEMGGYPELFHPPYQHGAPATVLAATL
jgi:hypothetical protein